MKTPLILALAVTALSASPAISQAPAPPQISVSGSAEVKVAPDEILLRLGVETRDESLDIAKKQNDERVSKALAFLKSKGVAGKNVQTDFVNIDQTYDENYSRTRVMVHVVRKSIEVKLTDIDSFEAILTGLLNSGVNNVHGMELRTSELRKHRDTARAMAIRAAREKADALAAELGVRRGKVYSVNANEWGGWGSAGGWGARYSGALQQNAVLNAGAPAEPSDSTLSVGQISVSASVQVSFLIE